MPQIARVPSYLRDLPDGKYQIALTGSAGGKDSEPLLLPFWIEAEPFRWSDTPLYMAMTDRFVDGDGKNPGALPAVRPEANFRGGDLQGVTQQIESGYFDKLGVRALWLSPFLQPAVDGTHRSERQVQRHCLSRLLARPSS